MPLETCIFSRHKRTKVGKDTFETAPYKGFCTFQISWFYGCKLHEIYSFICVFHLLEITKAEVHDIHFLKNIKQQLTDYVLLADKGYVSESIQLDFFQSEYIRLKTPKRRNQGNLKTQPYIFTKTRKRIEILFSQLGDMFLVRRNEAKTFEGLKTRILAKITALILIQFIYDRPINKVV